MLKQGVGLLVALCSAPGLGCTIRGNVSAGGTALEGVRVQLEGAASATTTTNAAGAYRFERLYGGGYKVTASKPGYDMTPTSRNVTLNRPFETVDVNFTAAPWPPVVAPVLGNISVTDMRVDGVWDSVNTANLLEVRHTRNRYTDPHVTRRVVFEFDLSGVRSAPVRSAVLDLTVRGCGGSVSGGFQLDFYGYRGDGTLNLSDAVAGDSLVASTPITTPPLQYHIDLTTFIRSVLNGGSVIAGLNIRSHVESVTSNIDEHCDIEGRLSTSATFPPPRLTISY